ncbi:MAG: Rieske (2Fe-2S) protein [Euryarchaeota archaeon]|nr:Rieske (2Fe-2S) protein [Euryarchaeota archaeon]
MRVSRRAVLGAVARLLAGVGLLGLALSGYSLKAGAPGRVSSSGTSGEVMVIKLDDLPDPGTVKFTAGGVPGILVRFNGQLKAFTATCTHMGCPVSGKKLATEGLLVCPCHGSTYDPLTGKRLSGPAPRPLREMAVQVREGNIYASAV